MSQKARLIIACPETCADVYWATCFSAPDPVIFIEQRGKKSLLMSDLEYGRAKKEAEVDEVISTSSYSRKLKSQGKKEVSEIEILTTVLHERKITSLEVPSYFPIRLARLLEEKGFTVDAIPDPFYPERQIKSEGEKKKIVNSIRATEEAIRFAIQTIRGTRIRGNKLLWNGAPLTSEKLRHLMELKMMERGYLGQKTIVACGKQAADPHCIGFGPLQPYQTIVLDVFPKSLESGYHGDVTRTVFKGTPSSKVISMYEAVRKAQAKGFSLVRSGVDARDVHAAVAKTMEEQGFKTDFKNGRPEGFIHTTGHGLGLDIHEPPRIGPRSTLLKKGQVVTVEPGLYYEKLGGVRIEDDVYVTHKGCEILSILPRDLQIL
ncbi:MAG: aminopeptidase P family protein [Deltaproteobacteria bacterium]|nr:aminopeptidase P family protein [Deltaproteobacteria bacterium]